MPDITIDDVNKLTFSQVGDPDLFPSCGVTDFTTPKDALKCLRLIYAERARCAKITDGILALFGHESEDLDLPEGGCSDHNIVDFNFVFDQRCPYCQAVQQAAKIRSSECLTT